MCEIKYKIQPSAITAICEGKISKLVYWKSACFFLESSISKRFPPLKRFKGTRQNKAPSGFLKLFLRALVPPPSSLITKRLCQLSAQTGWFSQTQQISRHFSLHPDTSKGIYSDKRTTLTEQEVSVFISSPSDAVLLIHSVTQSTNSTGNTKTFFFFCPYFSRSWRLVAADLGQIPVVGGRPGWADTDHSCLHSGSLRQLWLGDGLPADVQWQGTQLETVSTGGQHRGEWING